MLPKFADKAQVEHICRNVVKKCGTYSTNGQGEDFEEIFESSYHKYDPTGAEKNPKGAINLILMDMLLR